MSLPRQLIECELTLRHDDPLMRDHRVHGVRVMPGVTFLDIVTRLVRARGGEAERCALRDVLFIEPVVVTEEFDQRIRISLTPEPDGTWRVAGRSRRLRGETPEGDWHTNFEARLEMAGEAAALPAPVSRDLAALRGAAQREVDADAAYAISRQIDIHHFEFMKGLGRAWVGKDFVVADLHLSTLAADYLDHFWAHPAYLDAATVVFLLAQHRDETKARPFIPLTIERFTTTGRLPERCTVVIDRRRAQVESDDLVWGDLELYDADGLRLARLEKICYKHIRSHELITRLARGEGPGAEVEVRGEDRTNRADRTDRVGGTTVEVVRALVAGALGREPAGVALESGFYDQGLDSTHLLKLVRELETRLGERLYPTLLFEYSTVAALAEYLEGRFGPRLVATGAGTGGTDTPGVAAGTELLCLEAGWRPAALAESEGAADLVFVEERDLAGGWRQLWPEAVAVVAGNDFGWRDGRTVMMRRAHAEDAARLFDDLAARGRAAGRALFLWAWHEPAGIQEAVDVGVGSLLVLAQAALKRRLGLDWVAGHAAHPLLAAVSGFARTLFRENPRLVLRTVERGGDWRPDAAACARLAAEWTPRPEWDAQVRWRAGAREVRGWRENATAAGAAAGLPLRAGGVYLITGGAGGLARIFAAALRAQEPAAKLVLAGRSAPALDKAAELARLGAEYRVCDVADEATVARLVAEVRAAHGAIRGVLHTAGVLRDGQVPGKTREQLDTVLRPKVQGTLALDRALADEPLDFFVLFSSTAAAMGSAGQSDYSFANAFLDAWAEEREALRRAGARSGQTLSVNWPLWAEGGMTVDEATRADLAAHSGMMPLRSADGVAALARGLASGAAGWLVAAGDAAKLRGALRLGAVEELTDRPDRADPTDRTDRATELPEGAVAIIGVAGRYPGARTPAELWARLRAGEDLIREIPADRWDHAALYDPDRTKKGRVYSKWGGFLEDFDRFEPKFFNLSPREAELLDPQERLFLQTAWQTFENAGYNPAGKALRETGVFVGVMWNQYQLFGAEELLRGNPVAPNFSTASIANRVSYALNLSGPSLALDTMCSSSLTAIHLACESLRRGECKAALAGGVSLSLHPAKYLFLAENQMASSDGRCRTFGEGGDGYVPGEGVGAVLLKPLAQAVADGDVIHGVIRATAVNHGGKASGFTVPAPRAQATVVETALARAGVDPRRIGYIEAHGTGTSLGDPIEMAGLETAFRGAGRPAGSCAIGSVKSNFGHLEAAAGVAGLTKVLLQFEHGELAPSLHAETLNPHIDFARSVFRVQRERAAWPKPSGGGARVAGVSSFGAGGSNAHVVVEEWAEDRTDRTDLTNGAAELIVVSAEGEAALRELAGALAETVERGAGRGMRLRDLAFTLQTGRDGRTLRRAFAAKDLAEAVRGLRALAAGGRVEAPAEAAEWLGGAGVDWAARWKAGRARRVALPGYPFRGERYWLPVAPNGVGRRPRLHPLLDGWSGAASLAEGVVFTKRFVLTEPVLDQHRVRGRAVLPGVAHVEMAYAALAEVAAPEEQVLTKLFWQAPVVVDEAGCEVRVTLRKTEAGIAFALESADGARVYSQGVFVRREGRAEERLELARLAAGGRELAKETGDYYARHAATGVAYGSMYRLVRSLRRQGDEVLAELELGEEWTRELGRYRMHPGLFDAALHATADLMDGFGAGAAPLLPFAAGEVEWLRPLPARLRAYAVKAGYNLCHVALLDEDGRVCAKVKNLAAREQGAEPGAVVSAEEFRPQFYRPRWTPVARATGAAARGGRMALLACDAPAAAVRVLQDALAARGVRVEVSAVDVAGGKTPEISALDEIVLVVGREGAGAQPRAADEEALLALAHRLARAVAAAGRPAGLRLVTDGVLGDDAAGRWPRGASLHGFLRTAAGEIPALRLAGVDVPLRELAGPDGERLAGEILAEPAGNRGREVLFRGGRRLERRLDPVQLPAPAGRTFRSRGVYWIIGGLGHVGRALALHLAEQAQARIVLSGRRALDAEGKAHVRALEAAGAEVLYVQADAGDPAAMARADAAARERFGAVHGVFLSAVHLLSRHVVNLTAEELGASVAPKIQATAWAVERWRAEPLDFLAVFSSASTFEVNLGQAAYVAGGMFQDALVRSAMARLPFPVRLINWGYWASIATFKENMAERLAAAGVRPLRPTDGLAALERVLAGPAEQVLVLDMDEPLLRRLGVEFPGDAVGGARVPLSGRTVQRAAAEAPAKSGDQASVRTVESHVRGVFAAALKLRAADLDANATYDVYGIDSLVVTDITRRLETDFGELPATLLFQFGTIAKLSAHLAAQHAEACARVTAQARAVTAPAAVFGTAVASGEGEETRTDRTDGADATYGTEAGDDIAVIGVACRFAEAGTLDEFWANLMAGRCSVGEAPAERRQTGVAAAGSFLRDVDKFDAGFFRITPAEAEVIDPQARLVLEAAGTALEDAACSSARLERAGRKVGVFVGVMNSDYPLLDAADLAAWQGAVTGYSAIANRVSFHFDLRGPSLALDTACSSSLTALHLACQSLRAGECRLALAGGVNLMLHPKHPAALAGMGMISPTGRCRAFGAGADGMVPGEGVGVLLLKPLAEARRDGDPIRAVIKGTAANAGGRTGGFTVPNPSAQAEVVAEALRRAAVPPETVTYLEAHGTGTPLGDPIELAGLAEAFAGRAAEARCALGSVKGNLGHLESAAGIAGVCKVIAQFRAGRIAPSLFAENLNPKLRLERTPFFVAREGMEWARGQDAQGRPVPRRAGVSSFGAGGANAHVVLEEWVEGEDRMDRTDRTDRSERIGLSAKTPEALRERARRLREFLAAHPGTGLVDVARTLREGRDPMPVKWGARVRSIGELVARLDAFVAGRDAGDAVPEAGADAAGEGGRLIALPTYPFARERHWLAKAAADGAAKTDWTDRTGAAEGPELVFERAEWVEAAPMAVEAGGGRRVLVLAGAGDAWVEAYRGRADRVVTVRAGRVFRRVTTGCFEIAPGSARDAASLAQALAAEGVRPDVVVNAWAEKAFVPNGTAVAVQMEKGPLTWITLLGALRREQAGVLDCVQVVPGGREDPGWRAAAGFGRSLMREDGRIRFRVLGGPDAAVALGAAGDVVCGEAGRAWELRRAPGGAPRRMGEGWRERGIYLITGGAGGLGRKTARLLAREFGARLVLAGRSRPDAATEALLAELRGLGGEAVYVAADVATEAGARRAVEEVKTRFGALHGVVHAAGVIRDGFLLRKPAEDARAVLAPKVQAAVWLDAATRDEALEVFVLFSSFVATAGNAGQTDYAYANGFLDGFAVWRAAQVGAGRRRGATVSIGWGPWSDGGMRPAGAEDGAMMPDHPQVRAFSDEAGLAVLRAAAGAGEAHFTAELRTAKIAEHKTATESPGTGEEKTPAVDLAAVERLLTRLMAEVTKIPVARLEPRVSFEDFGIDSIVVMKFNQRLAALAGGELPRTLLYESRNLREMATYLCREYGGLMAKAVAGGDESGAASGAASAPAAGAGLKVAAGPATVAGRGVAKLDQADRADLTDRADRSHGTERETRRTDGIAVIGMACRFPGAETVEAFWDNLLQGRDAVRAVEGTRWPADPEGRIYCKAGGMLEGVDEFDPQFFNLSPREAKTIDPQERLFLQTTWHALEDAGYPKQRLHALGGGEGLGAPVGVFVGVTTNDYALLEGAEGARGQALPWSIANRVSYFLDLAGPSLPVDTACSSSLTAVHLAVESLRRGECRMAIVGGVNLYLHPAKLAAACQLQMLSRKGRCRSFGAEADGYVPGEGVGTVILKPLADAERDGDRIHGVIRSTAVNHGGRTHGYTVPNPRAQVALVRAALKAANVDARTVSYVEAHGTGTALGDPIEVRGLAQAFRADTSDRGFCALGSVKSNIGHLEAAAGVAGLIKNLLQLRHRTLAPTLHAATVNPAIDFAETPFRLQRVCGEWVQPTGADGMPAPRRAGLSSFGAGGANAHVIVEEYAGTAAVAGKDRTDRADRTDLTEEGPELLVFSARTEEALRESLRAWQRFLATPEAAATPWADLAHTLRVGREAWEERLAFVAPDRAALRAQIDAWVSGGEPVLPIWRGRAAAAGTGAASRLLENDEDAQAMIAQWVRKGKLAQLAELWVTGVGVDWSALPATAAGPRRIVALPGYAFARVRCWLDAPAAKAAAGREELVPAMERVAGTTARTDRADRTDPGIGYRPVWRVAPLGVEAAPATGGRVLIVYPAGTERLVAALGEAHAGERVETLALAGEATTWGAALAGLAEGATIYFLGGLFAPAASAAAAAERLGDLAWLAETQEAGVLSLFRLVRAAAERGLFQEAVTLKIVTGPVYPVRPEERSEPFAGPLAGLAKSLAKEYPRLRVAVLELAAGEVFAPADEAALRLLAEAVRTEPGRPDAAEVAWRAGRRYERVLEAAELEAVRAEPWVEGGVYAIVGGASGIGFELSRDLARRYHARVAWIGRRAPDETITRRQAEIAELGGEALYVQADVTDLAATERAAAAVRARFGPVRGLVHSALVIEENILERMSEATLRRGLAAKVTGTAVLWRVFGGERLDFMLLHSSAQAFIGNPGQGNYTAACHFMDAFAWAAAAVAPFPVRTIDWGWWGEVGHGARPEYQKRFPAGGLRSIGAEEGLAALNAVLRGEAVQVLALKARPAFLSGIGVDLGSRARRQTSGGRAVALAPCAARLAMPTPEPAELARLSEAFAAFEQLGFALLLGAFRRMGVFLAPGERWTLEALERRLELRPNYRRLLCALVHVLEKAGLAAAEGAEWVTTARGAAEGFAATPEPVTSAEALAQAHPNLAGHARLLGVVLAAYPEILRGERAAVEVLFPNSSTALMERIYTGNVVAAYYSGLVARAVVSHVEAALPGLAAGGRLTIVEAGAGTGGTSAAVLEALRPWADRVRYLYTDVSPAFARHFAQRFAARYPFAEFKVLDASRDVAAQGFVPGEADLVLAANALHATPRMAVTLREVKRLLKRGGWLVLDEVAEVQDYATLAFGLFDGWWLYEDAENRLPDSPLIASATWEALLAEAGFAPVVHVADPRLAGTGLGHDILVAESDGWVSEAAGATERGEAVERGGEVRAQAEGGARTEDRTYRTDGTEKALAAPAPMGAAELAEAVARGVEAELRTVLELEGPELDRDRAFIDFGVDSILAIDIANRLNVRFAVRLRPTDLYSHASLRKLSARICALGGRVAAKAEKARIEEPHGTEGPQGTPGRKGNGHAAARGQEAMLALLRDLQAGRRTVDDVDRAWENN